jgi:hypothetical protein
MMLVIEMALKVMNATHILMEEQSLDSFPYSETSVSARH